MIPFNVSAKTSNLSCRVLYIINPLPTESQKSHNSRPSFTSSCRQIRLHSLEKQQPVSPSRPRGPLGKLRALESILLKRDVCNHAMRTGTEFSDWMQALPRINKVVQWFYKCHYSRCTDRDIKPQLLTQFLLYFVASLNNMRFLHSKNEDLCSAQWYMDLTSGHYCNVNFSLSLACPKLYNFFCSLLLQSRYFLEILLSPRILHVYKSTCLSCSIPCCL